MKIVKYLISSIIFILVFTININVFANTKIKQIAVKETTGQIKFQDNMGSYEKKVQVIDSDKGNVLVTNEIITKIKNTKGMSNSEIILVIDNSSSMQAGDVDKKKLVFDNLEILVDLIFKNSEDVNLGGVIFSTDANVLFPLQNDKNEIKRILATEKKNGATGNTNMTAALEKAKSLFKQENKNKIIIALTDGYPNEGTSTKQFFLDEKNKDIFSIVMIAGLQAEDPQIQQVFGTKENPIPDKLYVIPNDKIEETMKDSIYKDMNFAREQYYSVKKLEEKINDEIIQNYDIIIENEKGKLDLKNKKIVWDLKNDTNTKIQLTYNLLLKNQNKKELLDKEIPINDEVEIKYNEINKISGKKEINLIKNKIFNTTKTPTIKLIANSEIGENGEKQNKDGTLANKRIPQTGDCKQFIGVALVISLISLMIFIIIKR